MDCGETRERLNDRIDGILPPDRTAEVDAHLRACARCRAEAEEIHRLREEAARLSRPVEPERDLWPGIAAALEGEGDVPERSPVQGRDRSLRRALRPFVPAAAVAAAALALVLFLEEPAGERSDPRTAAAPPPPEAARIAAAIRSECAPSVREMSHYLSRADGESETILRMRGDLDTLRRAAEETREAWLASPGDPFLGRRMREAHRKQAELQAEMVRVAAILAAAPGGGEGPDLSGGFPEAGVGGPRRSA